MGNRELDMKMKISRLRLPRLQISPFSTAVIAALVGAVAGGLATFQVVGWEMSQQRMQDRQSAACVLGGELEVVHLALLHLAQTKARDTTQDALNKWRQIRRIANFNSPHPETWALATKLEPNIARDISRFRVSVTSLLIEENPPIDPLPFVEMLRNMAGVSGSFSNQLKAICVHGGDYKPTVADRNFQLPAPTKR